jgi:ankyrin repeat protein
VKLLVEARVDVNQGNLSGMNGLLLACGYGKVECLRLLVEDNADVGCKDTKRGNTGLILAAMKGHSECTEVMLEGTTDINCRNSQGKSALLLAVDKRQLHA